MKLHAFSVCALALAACAGEPNDELPWVDIDGDGINDNDPTALRNFTLRIENVAPFEIVKSSVQRTRLDKTDGNLGPGEVYEMRFTAGFGHHLSLATMMFESNDWFFGTDPAGIPLYTNGVPLSGDITHLVKLWDAGTEYDEEPGVGANTGLLQPTRNAGAVDPDRRVRLVPDVALLSNGQQFVRPAVSSMIRVTIAQTAERQFTLRLENISTTETLVTSAGTREVTVTPVLWVVHCNPNVLFDANVAPRENGIEQLAESGNADTINNSLRLVRGIASPLSRGVYVVHSDGTPLFNEGSTDRSLGMEPIAEDGDPTQLRTSLEAGLVPFVDSHGVFDVPVEATEAGPCHAGQSFEFQFKARPGARLSLITGFSAANDWFISPPDVGMALFNGNLPRWGEITNEFHLYDLGTENDEELDVGANTGTQQRAANTGRIDRNTDVREVGRDRYDVPLTRHVRVTLQPPPRN
jgi:hypothetical protein